MAKVRYANTARINRKPDGSIVVSLYVNESKEYFNKAVARARTARTTATRRKVKISKTDKERHREKIKISGYLEANQWEYVLRVPVPNNNHAAVWRSFTEKYRYRHKYAKLQYLMIKGAGELYGVISNAPVEDGKIPLVDIEHEVLGVFNVSMIGAMERMTLQYNRTGTDKAYMNSKGLNKKTYDYINLDNIEQFELPDDALLTVGQASIVFDGGTAEENETAMQQFLKEKKVQEVAENTEKEEMIRYIKSCFNKEYTEIVDNIDKVIFDKKYIETPEKIRLRYEEKEGMYIVTASYNGYDLLEQIRIGGGRRIYNYTHSQYCFPYVYMISNFENDMIYYIGQTREPLKRYCQHFGIQQFIKSKGQENESPFYKYVVRTKPEDKSLKDAMSEYYMLFVPLLKYEDENQKVKKYLPKYSKSRTDIELAEARFQNIILQLEEKGKKKIFRENGRPLFHQGKSQENYEKRIKEYKEKYDMKSDPVRMCIKTTRDLYGGFLDVRDVANDVRIGELAQINQQPEDVKEFLKEYLNKRYKREDEILGLNSRISGFFRAGFDLNVTDEEKEFFQFVMHTVGQNRLEKGTVGNRIGKTSWSDDGKKVTETYCFAVNGCIGTMKESEYPCFNGKECKCFVVETKSTVFDDEQI